MAMEVARACPSCEGERTFYRAASTTLHLGTKVKWRCPDCGFAFVTIDGTVDTGV